MNLNNIKNELKKFDRYKFYEEPHVYTYIDDDDNEIPLETSVTSLIDDYTNYFDKEKIAGIKAKKENIPKDDLLKKWAFDNNLACTKGTITHAYNEHLWKNESYEYNKQEIMDMFGKDVIEPIWDKLKKISDRYYNKYKDFLIPIGLEQIIGSIEYNIAGTIDFLAYSKKLDAIVIIDYKTNKEITKKSFNNQKMLYPLNEITDSNYYHYSLQLAIYKHILEHETNLKICSRKWLVWINENNDDFKLIECANLDKEAEILLESRKIEV